MTKFTYISGNSKFYIRPTKVGYAAVIDIEGKSLDVYEFKTYIQAASFIKSCFRVNDILKILVTYHEH